MNRIRFALNHLAQSDPSLRSVLVPVVRQAGKWNSLPKGWTQDSVEKFWGTMTGESKHKVTECIKKMDGKIDDPGAFCASLADKVMGPEWRKKKANNRGSDMVHDLAARKLAFNTIPVSTVTLPAVIKRVLAEVRFSKRKISVRTSTSFSMYSAGDDGAKGFTALVDIDTQQYKITWGDFGGGGLGQKPSPVDDVNTPKKPMLDFMVVVQGQIGGRDPYASIICTESALPRLTGGARQASESVQVAARYIRAFNKFNAPELVSQLLAVLAQEGLDDALTEIKAKKVPQLVEKAWATRRKTAAIKRISIMNTISKITNISKTTKAAMARQASESAQVARVAARYMRQASPLKQMVSDLFQDVVPFVENEAKFLHRVYEEMLEWPQNWSEEGYVQQDAQITSEQQVAWLKRSRNRSGDPQWDDDDDEIYQDVVQSIAITMDSTLNLRKFPRALFQSFQNLVTDPKGFVRAVVMLTKDTHKLQLMARAMTMAYQQDINKHPNLLEEVAEDYIKSLADDAGDFDVEYRVSEAHFGAPKARIQGSELIVTVEGEADLDADSISHDSDYESA